MPEPSRSDEKRSEGNAPEIRQQQLADRLGRLRGADRTLLDALEQLLDRAEHATADRRCHGPVRVAVFDTKPYDQKSLSRHNQGRFDLIFHTVPLGPNSAAAAAGCSAVCAFVNDVISAEVVRQLRGHGVELLALRCAGYNNVDLAACAEHGLTVVRVPAYSPHAVAEHAVGLMLALNRKYHLAYQRVRSGIFRLDGLEGFDMFGKVVGVAGTGVIGCCVIDILRGFGCEVLAYDRFENPAVAGRPGVRYADWPELLAESDILTLHLPLTPETRHLLDEAAFARMKPGVMIINTGRGALIDTPALIAGLKSGHVGAAGLDVYEEEAGVFFEDLSDTVLTDDVLARLLTFHNVLVTSHQGFLTREALANIATTTLDNIQAYVEGKRGAALVNRVPLPEM